MLGVQRVGPPLSQPIAGGMLPNGKAVPPKKLALFQVTLPAFQFCCISWARKSIARPSPDGLISVWLMKKDALLICTLEGSWLKSYWSSIRMALGPL